MTRHVLHGAEYGCQVSKSEFKQKHDNIVGVQQFARPAHLELADLYICRTK